MRIRYLSLGLILACTLGSAAAEAGCRPVRHVVCNCAPVHHSAAHHREARAWQQPAPQSHRYAESFYDYRSSSRVTITQHHSAWRSAPDEGAYDDGAGYGPQGFVDGYGEAHYGDAPGYAADGYAPGGYDNGADYGNRGVPYAYYNQGYEDGGAYEGGAYGGQGYYGGYHGLHGGIGADAHVGPIHAGVHMGGHVGTSIGSGIGANVGIGSFDIGAHVGSGAGFR